MRSGKKSYDYYRASLAGERLRRVYDLAPPRVRQYLEAEISHVLRRTGRGSRILEMGCGYGRVIPRLAEKARMVVGIDTSRESLNLARREVGQLPGCYLLAMDAAEPAFAGGSFDYVVCIQNGISAFHVDQSRLIHEGVRVTRPGGKVLFSTYAPGFWAERLGWFELQARAGLVGEIDYDATKDGVIVCKDGFTATTVSAEIFRMLTADLNAAVEVVEVDASSLFCEIIPS
jgi:SAM-dependent methyltransferase